MLLKNRSVYSLFLEINKMENKQKRNPNQKNFWCDHRSCKTASILQVHLATVLKELGMLLQTSWRTNRSSVDVRLPQMLLSLHVNDVAIRALWGPNHHFQDSLKCSPKLARNPHHASLLPVDTYY